MLLGKCRSMDGLHVMRHFAKDDVLIRFVHHGNGGAGEFAMIIVGRRRGCLLVAGRKAKLRVEDEGIIA
jgi:hypothetical protein